MGELFPLIKELSEIVAPSGQEAAINERIESLWKDAGAKVKRTGIGNVIGRVGGKGKIFCSPRTATNSPIWC